jgi:hypothetical protein
MLVTVITAARQDKETHELDEPEQAHLPLTDGEDQPCDF